jgi:hypothetical protein
VFEIGSSLREARLRKGLDFLEVERATKIRAKYLRALEQERFDLLPSQTYVRGFLRSYADFLGLDGRLFVDEYTSRFWIDEEGGQRRARRVRVREQRQRRAERTMVLLALGALAAVSALVIAAWNFGGGGGGGAAAPDPPAPAQARPGAARAAHLVVRALRGSSLLEVRRGGPSGPVLYTGTLERGEAQRFLEKRLWLHVGTPENLQVSLNGQPADLGRRCPQVVVVTPRQVTSAASCR